MRQNYTQILGKTLKVADTTDAVARYGRAKETAYQLGKYSKEIKRDLEAILTSSQSSAVGSTSVAANTACFSAQIDSGNLSKTGGSGTAMTETVFLTALQTLFNNGVDPKVTLIPPAESINVANYASASGRYRTIDTSDTGSNQKIVNAVNLYVSPFGEVKVALSRFQPAIDHLIYDPQYWKLAVLRSWTRETLAKTGDATKMMLIGEFGLIHRAQKASGVVRKSA